MLERDYRALPSTPATASAGPSSMTPPGTIPRTDATSSGTFEGMEMNSKGMTRDMFQWVQMKGKYYKDFGFGPGRGFYGDKGGAYYASKKELKYKPEL